MSNPVYKSGGDGIHAFEIESLIDSNSMNRLKILLVPFFKFHISLRLMKYF
jgi:hypothetical protein